MTQIKALSKWLATPTGRNCAQGIGGPLHGHYMTNRVSLAFNAGYVAAITQGTARSSHKKKRQTCVWRPFIHDKKNWLDIGCRYSWIESNCIGGPNGWRFCPWCGKRIKVEKARKR